MFDLRQNQLTIEARWGGTISCGFAAYDDGRALYYFNQFLAHGNFFLQITLLNIILNYYNLEKKHLNIYFFKYAKSTIEKFLKSMIVMLYYHFFFYFLNLNSDPERIKDSKKKTLIYILFTITITMRFMIFTILYILSIKLAKSVQFS